jgi:hypothetical protein
LKAKVLLPLVFASWLLVASAVLANPLPPGLILPHVQPPVANFCDDPITACSQLVQHTTSQGLLEFDLFLYPTIFPGPIEVSRMQTAVEWPSEWSFLDYEICHDGQGTVDILNDGAILDIAWPTCPMLTDEIFLAVRFTLLVDRHGELRSRQGYESKVVFGCPPVDSLDMYVSSGEAGVECAYCDQPCDLSWACMPDPDPTSLALEVIEGGSTTSAIHVPIVGGDLITPCAIDFVVTESWMQVTATELGWQDWSVTLEVQTAGLAPGSYDGWVRMESECVGCTYVTLEVLPEGTAADDGLVTTTWGRLKTLYR